MPPRPNTKRRSTRRFTTAHAAYLILSVVAIAGAFLILRPSSTSAPDAPRAPGAPGDTAAAAPGAAQVEARTLELNRPAPDFTADSMNGGGRLTLSSLRGKAVMVNFFASWCTSCAHELPAIQSEYLAHAAQGFAVVGVNSLENGDGPAFYRRYGLTFPAVYDPGLPGRIGAAYHVTNGLPASVFIDRDGRVDAIYPGEVTTAIIESELRKLHVG